MTTQLSFEQVLSVLSKSSPYSVSTIRDSEQTSALDDVKKYLHIKDTAIEKDFYRELIGISPNSGNIIFLCGSSGDGKSEILTRYSADFNNKAEFHLDATHSFEPYETAIQTLDKVFAKNINDQRSLVVGINIGMLGNYAEEGAYDEICASIKAFLNNEPTPTNHVYLNFESYPKFQLGDEKHSAKFAKDLLKRITAKDDNLIRQYFDKEKVTGNSNGWLCANYELLAIDEVQDVIIDLLFKARLVKDQFITARALLDFYYHLLCGNKKHLYDNLFLSVQNELIAKISTFDPANIRARRTDDFVLSHSLKLPDDKFASYQKELRNLGLLIRTNTAAASYIRLFYLFRNLDFANNYHHEFRADFEETLIAQYAKFWHLHHSDGFSAVREDIKAFYKYLLVPAIFKYNNRHAPVLGNKEFLISIKNGFVLAANLDLKVDLNKVERGEFKDCTKVGCFYVCLKIGKKQLSPIAMNINLLELLLKINAGYRPNKHDKNAVVLLDEFIAQLLHLANLSTSLIIKKGKLARKLTIDDEEIEVEWE